MGVDLIGLWLIGELLPDGPHQWLSGVRHSLEGSVDVVDKVVALVNGSSDSRLNTVALKPGLTVWCVDLSVCAEKGVESTKLVELNVQIICNLAVKARDI